MTIDVDKYVNKNFDSPPGSPEYDGSGRWGSAKKRLYTAIKNSIEDYMIWQSLKSLEEHIESGEGFLEPPDDLEDFVNNYAVEDPRAPIEHEEIDLGEEEGTKYIEHIDDEATTGATMAANFAVPIIDILFDELEGRMSLGVYEVVEAIKKTILNTPPNQNGAVSQLPLVTALKKVEARNNITIT